MTVRFNTAEIIDDGDSWPSGAGKFHDSLTVGWFDADSGTTVHLNKSIVRTQFLKGHMLTLHARVNEDDCSWGEFCTSGTPDTEISPETNNGQNDDLTWITGEVGPYFILLDDFDPDYGKQRPFTINPESGFYDLHVVIHGTYEVDYD